MPKLCLYMFWPLHLQTMLQEQCAGPPNIGFERKLDSFPASILAARSVHQGRPGNLINLPSRHCRDSEKRSNIGLGSMRWKLFPFWCAGATTWGNRGCVISWTAPRVSVQPLLNKEGKDRNLLSIALRRTVDILESGILHHV